MMATPAGPRLLVCVRLRECPPSCTVPLRSTPAASSQASAAWLSACSSSAVQAGHACDTAQHTHMHTHMHTQF